MTQRPPLRLRAGDTVVVRPRQEILATLDGQGRLDGLPFMPEMLQYCGRRFRVSAIAHKTCDPARKTGGRRLGESVHLEDLRCDGAAHGGCQASCLLFWKTAWLERAGANDDHAAPAAAPPPEPALIAATSGPGSTPNAPRYSCQATCLYDATAPLAWWNASQYVRDVGSGNVSLSRAARILVLSWLRALLRSGVGYRPALRVYRYAHRLLLGTEAPEHGGGLLPAGAPTPVRALELQPGERIRVRSHREIRETLTLDNKNRGMWFDDEQTVFCGGEYEVEQRVERIINEVTGEMMEMKTPCITLRGVHCRSVYSRCRLFCPRAIKPYWREIWLEPVSRSAGRRAAAE